MTMGMGTAVPISRGALVTPRGYDFRPPATVASTYNNPLQSDTSASHPPPTMLGCPNMTVLVLQSDILDAAGLDWRTAAQLVLNRSPRKDHDTVILVRAQTMDEVASPERPAAAAPGAAADADPHFLPAPKPITGPPAN